MIEALMGDYCKLGTVRCLYREELVHQSDEGTSNDVTRACANTMGGKLLCNTLVKYCEAIHGY